MSQRFPLDIGHDVVEQAARLARREDRHDVGMTEVRGEVDLTDEPLTEQAGRDLGVQHLDRHAATGVLLHREVDPRHTARADFPFDIVARGEALTQHVEHIEHQRPTYPATPH